MTTPVKSHVLLLAILTMPFLWLSNDALAQKANSNSSVSFLNNFDDSQNYYSLNKTDLVASTLESLQEKIHLEVNNASLEDVLSQITKNSELRLVYHEQLINEMNGITASFSNISRMDALTSILDNTGLEFNIASNGHIVLNKSIAHATETSVQAVISGRITDGENGEPLIGVSILLQGTNTGTATNTEGEFSLSVPEADGVLIISYIGYIRQEVPIDGRSEINIVMMPDDYALQEIVVVGYGVQQRSDITGSVASVPVERLEMVPNLNIAQVIQGAVPGVMVQTSAAGAASEEVLMVRGRNSILASNDPLVVVDGVPYGGALRDINTNDIASIEVLKDASAAAIYGSRGANGVILITTKEGRTDATRVSYEGRYSTQSYANIPNYMSGEEFYQFKLEREPGMFTATELDVYESGEWVDWTDLTYRPGHSQQHNLSVSGGFQNTRYFISGNLLDVQGIQLNDNYLRVSGRVNLDTEVADWLTLGTRTNISYDDRSGVPVDHPSRMNPLSRPYDQDGNLTIYPWPEDIHFSNPLQSTLWENINESHQVATNNYAIVNFPFVTGLSYRINTGVRTRFSDQGTYKGRNSTDGFELRGSSSTSRQRSNSATVENILSHNGDIGRHSFFTTALFSYEKNTFSSQSVSASRYPHDFLTWYSAGQAEVSNPSYSFTSDVLISQMIRLNYNYDSRYLLTLTGRRDGFSGFGAENKWGIFPSIAVGWNVAREDFFPWKNTFNELKPRLSWGLNGNQAVGAYQTMTRLSSVNWVSQKNSLPGYVPSTIGMDDLGWESSSTINLGLDFGIYDDRFSGDINVYKTNTTDLLLNRTISPVHGITEITQNIGETENRGVEMIVRSRNIHTPFFSWSTSANAAFVQNKIVSLYGFLDEDGNELDDVANRWFIGKPIRVNYNYIIDGVWQLDEAEEAAAWGSQPGFVKFRDVNGDGLLTPDEDRQIQGQLDPKFLWGMSNTFSIRNLSLDIFIHGVHGVTKDNPFMQDDVYPGVRRNTINKNRWTPDNPTNDFYMNHVNAHRMAGVEAEDDNWFENAGFIRVKDISLSYNFTGPWFQGTGLNNLRLYVTGRNLFTFTEWNGLDPELDDQRYIPLQREFVVGVNMEF